MSYRSTVDRSPSARSLPDHVPANRPLSATQVSCFHVVAEAHPGAIGRLLEVVAKRGLVPSYLHSILGGRDGDELAVDLQVAGLDEATRTLVAAQLRAAVTVRTVLTSVKTFAD